MAGIDMNQAMAALSAMSAQKAEGGEAAAPVVLTEEEKAAKRTKLVGGIPLVSQTLCRLSACFSLLIIPTARDAHTGTPPNTKQPGIPGIQKISQSSREWCSRFSFLPRSCSRISFLTTCSRFSFLPT